MRDRAGALLPAAAAGGAAALVVAAAVIWLEAEDQAVGALPWVIPEVWETDRVGPQIAFLAWPGFIWGALAVGVVGWFAGQEHARAVRLRAAVVGFLTSGVLLFVHTRWLLRENPLKPWLVAKEAYRWGLVFIGPSTGLLTAVAVAAALGGGAVRLPYRSRTALAAAVATGGLFAVGIEVLRRAQPDHMEPLGQAYWILLVAGVPLVALLAGLLVHATAARTLRSVDAIRRELADITDQSLDRRVPVPATDDVITRLAVTTNSTLDRLEQAHVRQQQFVADAAHELRSPLTALRTQLESALRHPEVIGDWPEVVAQAAEDVVRLQALADDLLLLASHRATAPAGEPVDLAALAEDLVREHQHLPDAAGLRLACEAPAQAPVRGDAVRLERVLRNLLANACRYARTSVTVVVAPEGPAVALVVEDDGPGIPPADRARVFDRFTRLDASRTRASGGAGLGLPIARDIVTHHGGTLVIEDSPEGARLAARFPAEA
ncbi:sensor histidine kinase [Streptomyces sp. NPDC058877]|uniref:sensor histidine kinase n=1 Tax=unclassified Streptomyces TaxID=2593676 RepID=UPI0036A3CCA0